MTGEKFTPREITAKDGRKILLREAEKKDAQNALSYMNRIGGESDNLLFGAGDFTMSTEQEEAFLEGEKAKERSIVLVALDGGDIVGIASVSAFSHRERIAHRGELGISISRSHWGLGIGKGMVAGLIEFAESVGIEVIQLEVKADNERGISLYRHMGFEPVGTYRKFFKIDGKYYDAQMMNLYLQEGDKRP